MNTLNKLRDEALRIATEKGFVNASPAELIALIHSEVSEALEHLRLDNEGGAPHNKMMYSYKGYSALSDQPFLSSTSTGETVRGKPEGVPAEMADVIIRVLHFCGVHGIDIEQAVKEKMVYNETRPFRHGKKF